MAQVERAWRGMRHATCAAPSLLRLGVCVCIECSSSAFAHAAGYAGSSAHGSSWPWPCPRATGTAIRGRPHVGDVFRWPRSHHHHHGECGSFREDELELGPLEAINSANLQRNVWDHAITASSLARHGAESAHAGAHAHMPEELCE